MMTDLQKIILIVEDEDDHYELIQRAFQRASLGSLEHARNLQEARQQIERLHPDLVITDWKLPDGDGIELIAKNSAGPYRYPVIVMTSHGNEAWAVEAMKRGALDYIVKSPSSFSEIPGRASRALKEWANITERKAAENALQEEKEFTEAAINTMRGIFFVLDGRHRYVRWNRSLEDELYSDGETLLGKEHLQAVHPGDRELVLKKFTEVFAMGYAEWEARLLVRGEEGRDYFLTARKMYSGGTGYIVGAGIDITERKQAEETILRSREYISLILNSTAEGIYGMDLEGRCTFCNAAGVRMLGYADEGDLLGRNIHKLIHHTRENGEAYPEEECESRQVMATGRHIHREREFLWQKNGKGFPVEFWVYPLMERGELRGSVCTFIDVTTRTTLEHQLRQSQKMEAIGVLAGGVAHDFNNILTAIIGYGNIIHRKMDSQDPSRMYLDQILAAADRAAGLTHSLLAFSRKQVINPKNIDLNETILRVERFLSRIIGEDIGLSTKLSDEPLTVFVDAGQIEQVLMNLATNARDAMPKGGKLIIETSRKEFDEVQAAEQSLPKKGAYAVCTVTDTGSGIDDRMKEKIFEPFFTTKEVGKGTGLGLSIVYGIVRQNNGQIILRSEPARGAIFDLFFPITDTRAGDGILPAPALHQGGTETIMVAEDNPAVRSITRVVLQEFGYTVLEAGDGEEALAMLTNHEGRIDLAILDVIMPKRNGRDVFTEIKKIHPEIKALFTSGYPVELIESQGVLEKGMPFLPKPSSPQEILKKVRSVLNGRG